jgi:hypothetical protein
MLPMIRCILLYAISLALLPACSSAQEAQAAPAEQDPQVRAEALLQHARELSDIRSANSPAFRLKASFSFPGEDLQTIQGTYTEIWLSTTRWRREVIIGDLHRIDVGGSGEHWISFPDGFPQEADQLSYMFAVTPPATAELTFTSVEERVNAEVAADCAYTKPVVENLSSSYCFEKQTGLLIEKTFPEKRLQNLVRRSCGYRTFHKIRDSWFPYDVVCFEDRHKTMTAHVEELMFESNADPALFVPPAGAAEIGECAGKAVGPVYSHLALNPMVYGERLDDPSRAQWVKVWVVVDKKGKPQTVKVVPSRVKESTKNIADFIRNFYFKPGTCDGKPMPMALYLEWHVRSAR